MRFRAAQVATSAVVKLGYVGKQVSTVGVRVRVLRWDQGRSRAPRPRSFVCDSPPLRWTTCAGASTRVGCQGRDGGGAARQQPHDGLHLASCPAHHVGTHNARSHLPSRKRPVAQSPGTARRGWRSRRGPQGIVLRRALTSSRRLACPSLHACRTLASGSNGLEQTGSQYISKSEGGMVGGGGIQTYTFKAAGQGENTLEFVYKVRRGLVCVCARARARVCQSIVSVDG
jgi:hypothetical protein